MSDVPNTYISKIVDGERYVLASLYDGAYAELFRLRAELDAAREVGGVMLYELHYHMGCDQRCEKTYHPHFHASNSLPNNQP